MRGDELAQEREREVPEALAMRGISRLHTGHFRRITVIEVETPPSTQLRIERGPEEDSARLRRILGEERGEAEPDFGDDAEIRGDPRCDERARVERERAKGRPPCSSTTVDLEGEHEIREFREGVGFMGVQRGGERAKGELRPNVRGGRRVVRVRGDDDEPSVIRVFTSACFEEGLEREIEEEMAEVVDGEV